MLKTLWVGTCALLALPLVSPARADDSSPYQVNLLYTGEAWDNAAGGLKRGGIYMQNVDAALYVDTDRAFGWTGGRFQFEAFYETSASLALQKVGAIDVQSSIDTTGPEMLRIYQVFYDQTLGNTDVRFGIYDLETEFSNTKPELLFLSKNFTWNTAYDMSGTMTENGTLGPGNYPYTPLALRVRQNFGNGWSVQAALADGAADNPRNESNNAVVISPAYGALGIAEVDFAPGSTTKLMAGAWGLTSRLPAYGSQPNLTTRGEEGGYAGGAMRLYSAGGRRGLDGFFTLGYGSPETTSTTYSANAGLTYTGLLDARPRDKAGIAVAVNGVSPDYRRAMIAAGSNAYATETNIELTWRATITSWLTVQPDAQYIIHPGYAPGLKNDFVVGLHFEIGHLFEL